MNNINGYKAFYLKPISSLKVKICFKMIPEKLKDEYLKKFKNLPTEKKILEFLKKIEENKEIIEENLNDGISFEDWISY